MTGWDIYTEFIDAGGNDDILAERAEKIYGVDLEEQYDGMLDEIYGMVEVAGSQYDTSTALERIDKVMYDQGKHEYADSQIEDGYLVEDGNGNYYEADSVVKLTEEVRDELEAEKATSDEMFGKDEPEEDEEAPPGEPEEDGEMM